MNLYNSVLKFNKVLCLIVFKTGLVLYKIIKDVYIIYPF